MRTWFSSLDTMQCSKCSVIEQSRLKFRLEVDELCEGRVSEQ